MKFMTLIQTNNQFSKYANEYKNHNIIQQIISKALIRDIKSKPLKILELGCGSGQVFEHINWDITTYDAIDSSIQMCKLHPKDTNIHVSCYDFDNKDFFEFISGKKYDMVLSSSSLQWSNNIDYLLENISQITPEFNSVLFTSNTFKKIQDITNSKSPILSAEKIKESFTKYFKCEFEILNYKLEFKTKKEMFNYIKKSGVSGKSILSYSNAKKLYKEYNINYLEFEVIFIKAFSKSYSS